MMQRPKLLSAPTHPSSGPRRGFPCAKSRTAIRSRVEYLKGLYSASFLLRRRGHESPQYAACWSGGSRLRHGSDRKNPALSAASSVRNALFCGRRAIFYRDLVWCQPPSLVRVARDRPSTRLFWYDARRRSSTARCARPSKINLEYEEDRATAAERRSGA